MLKILHDSQISILDLLLDIQQSDNPEFMKHQAGFLANPSGKLVKLLDHVFEDKHGRSAVMSWVEQLAVDIISDMVMKEMEDIKTSLKWTINNTTPDTLLTWDINMIIGLLVENKAPTLGCLLQAASQTKCAKGKNRIKLCTTVCVCILIISEIH